MRFGNQKYSVAIILVAVLLASCAQFNQARAIDREDIVKLQSTIIYLTTSVENLYRIKALPADASNQAILDMATAKDPALRQDLDDYSVKFKNELGHAVVLICTKDGRQALLEKTGCSMGPDKKPWESGQVQPCEFTIDPAFMQKACGIGK